MGSSGSPEESNFHGFFSSTASLSLSWASSFLTAPGSRFCQALAEALKVNSCITSISFKYGDIRDEGAKACRVGWEACCVMPWHWEVSEVLSRKWRAFLGFSFLFFSSGFTSLSWASSFVKTISEGSQIYLNIRLFKVFTIQRFLSLDANLDLAVASARRWPRL